MAKKSSKYKGTMGGGGGRHPGHKAKPKGKSKKRKHAY